MRSSSKRPNLYLLGRQLRLLCLLLSVTSTCPAEQLSGLTLGQVLQATLSSNREVQIRNAQVKAAEGAILQAQGAFDTVMTLDLSKNSDRRLLTQSEKLTTPNQAEQHDNGAGLTAGFEKRLISGQTLIGNISTAYANDNISTQSGIPSQTTRKITFGLRMPLAKGSGTENAASATQKAAEFDWEESLAQKRFVLSQAIRDAVIAYWAYLSSWRELDLTRNAEQRAAELIEELRKLIAADEIPAADLDLALANHSERINARIAAEQSLLQARQILGQVMGMEAQKLSAMPPPSGDFPAANDDNQPLGHLPSLIDRALTRRGDWQAQAHRIAALRQRVAAAKDLTRPQVDLSVNVSSAGLREGASPGEAYSPYAGSFAGPSISTQLSIQFPFANQTAEGQLRQTSALLTEAEIRRAILQTQITAAVELTTADLQRSTESLRISGNIVQRYAKTFDNARIKRRLGAATLIDVINVEDRYFRAQIEDVQRRHNYASNVARLGHEVDALLRITGDGFEVREADFVQINAP